jgi:hypothetical protein
MIEILIKHYIYEYAINVLFDKIHNNFSFAATDHQFKEGQYIKYLKVTWLNYTLIIRNAKILDVMNMSILGDIINISTRERVTIWQHLPDIMNDFDEKFNAQFGIDPPKKLLAAKFTPCHDSHSEYYLNNALSFTQADIKDIII